jgi:hypothetical protein
MSNLTLLRLSTPDSFRLLASSPFSGLATYSSSRLFSGEECDELESEAGGMPHTPLGGPETKELG